MQSKSERIHRGEIRVAVRDTDVWSFSENDDDDLNVSVSRGELMVVISCMNDLAIVFIPRSGLLCWLSVWRLKNVTG